MAALSPELVYSVLLRLPVKSLLRLRCLSKSSCAEIDSADFVKNHLKRSVQSKASQRLIIINVVDWPNKNKVVNYRFYFSCFDDDLRDTFPLNNPLRFQRSFTFICGSCNGLILLGTVNFLGTGTFQSFNNLVIWNPFTRRHKKIPLSPPIIRDVVGYGLGYDSALDDYKIVLLISKNSVCSQVWVFSLKSNYWKYSQDMAPDNPRIPEGYFANGALYWAICSPFKNNFVGFDLTNEVFFDLPNLPECGRKTDCIYSLLDLGGNLYTHTTHAMRCDMRGTTEFYLLVSDKHGEVASVNWRKEFTVESFMRCTILRPLAYSKDGDSILLVVFGNGLFWYNLEKKTKQRVEIGAWQRWSSHHVCWENLVSLGNDSAFDGAAEEVIYT